MAEYQSLDEWVTDQSDLVKTLRQQGGYYADHFPVVPNEYSNWIDELRASVEACALADLSHHMTAVQLEGPDAIRLLKRLCVNDFDHFAIGQAKQIVMCNPDGFMLGDGPLLRLGEDTFYGPGIHATKWIRYQVETAGYDVELAIEPPTPLLPGDPEAFVYQVQGPNAYDVLEKLTDADLRAIGFYRFEDIDLGGYPVRAFGHGMSPEAGFELHGAFDNARAVRSALVEAGAPYGLKELGSKTYVANSVRLGWLPANIKPVYVSESMAGYRRWATGEKERKYGKWGTSKEPLEAVASIEGSFDSDDIIDYYMRPVELGYAKLIDLDHDFIGREAVAQELAEPRRTLVSLFWDRTDVDRIQTALFHEGPNYKYMGSLPRIGWARTAYDRVTIDGNLVGTSHSRSFEWDIRGVVSLCLIDVEHSDPGTEVTIEWGEPGGTSPNPTIEAHEATEIAATVVEAPYVPDRR